MKNEDIALDKARELVGDAAVWPRVRDFLWDFAPQIHASWLADVLGQETRDERREGDEVPSLVSRLSSYPRVKRFILDQLGVEPCFHDFPKDDGSRLLLFDGSMLLEMIKWLGALACAEELRKVTDGKTVRALKSELAGVYPEVFGYTAYFGGVSSSYASRGDAGTQSLSDIVVSTGLVLLFSALADLPASLVSRLKLKFPRRLCASASPRETKGIIGISAILKLLKLRFPEAYKICC